MFDELMKEATAIPFTSKMRFLTELQQPWGMPPEPVLDVDTATGLFKIAAIIKVAQDDEQQAALDLEHQAMIDPQVQQALDYQQMRNERDEAAAQTREMNQQLFDAQSAQAMADQQAQTMGQQISELQGQIEQETAGRQDAQTQMIASKDQSLQEQMAVQDQKQQMNVAAQTFQEQANMLTQQLKGIAAQPTAAAPGGPPGMEGMPGAAGGEMPPPASAGAAQEQQEAMNAQQDAAIQGGQAQQATEEDMIKQEQAAAMQGGPPGMAGPQPGMEMPKQASKRSVMGRIGRAFGKATPAQKTNETLKMQLRTGRPAQKIPFQEAEEEFYKRRGKRVVKGAAGGVAVGGAAVLGTKALSGKKKEMPKQGSAAGIEKIKQAFYLHRPRKPLEKSASVEGAVARILKIGQSAHRKEASALMGTYEYRTQVGTNPLWVPDADEARDLSGSGTKINPSGFSAYVGDLRGGSRDQLPRIRHSNFSRIRKHTKMSAG